MWRRVSSLSLLLLAGCTVLSSQQPAELLRSGAAPRGVTYSLPKAMVTVKLFVESDQPSFYVDVDTVEHIADERHRYFLKYRPLPNYDDDIKIDVTPSTFLKTVDVTTEDKTDEIIVNLAGAASALGGFETSAIPGTAEMVASFSVDPADPGEISAVQWALNDRAMQVAEARFQVCQDLLTAASGQIGTLESRAAEADLAAIETGLEKEKQEEARKALLKEIADSGNLKDPRLRERLAAADRSWRQATRAAEHAAAKATQLKTMLNDTEETAAATTRCAPVSNAYRQLLAGLITACSRHHGSKAGLSRTCDAYRERWSRRIGTKARGIPSFPLYFRIEVEAPPPPVPAPTADCTIGICYRAKEPHILVYWLGENRYSRIVEIPNSSQVVSIDIRRAFLVKKLQKIEFNEKDGSLEKVTIDKKSELLAAAKLPADVIKAIGDAIPLRAEIYTQRKNLADREVSLLKAKSELRDAKAKSRVSLSEGNESKAQGGRDSAAQLKRLVPAGSPFRGGENNGR